MDKENLHMAVYCYAIVNTPWSVIIFGGFNMQGSTDFETDEVWEFSGSWRKKGQLTKPRGGLGAVYHNRKVLVVGGNGQMYVAMCCLVINFRFSIRPSEVFVLDHNWKESVFVGEPFNYFYSYPELFIVEKDFCYGS